MRSPRHRCPGCDHRRVLYAVDPIGELTFDDVCADCGMLLSMARAYVWLGITVRLLQSPDLMARIEAMSESFAAALRLLA